MHRAQSLHSYKWKNSLNKEGHYKDCIEKEQETRSDIEATWNEETSPHHTA